MLVVLGAAVKLLGAGLSSSRALLVDGITCIAAIVSLIFMVWFFRASMSPPDEEHPYGHRRMKYGGVLATVSTYMFAAGASLVAVVTGLRGYQVGYEAVPAAVAGGGIYALALLVSRRVDPATRIYTRLTSSELVESGVAAVGALLGYLSSYVYDLIGAAIVLGYIMREALEAHRYLVDILSDRSAPSSLYRLVENEAASRGFTVTKIRLRMLDEKHCSGDVELLVPRDMPLEVADILADEISDNLSKLGCDVTIHVGVERREEARKDSQLRESRA